MSSDSAEHRKLAAIMFTDMVGYSAVTQRNESLAIALLDEHHRLLRPLFPKFGGREIKLTGDGFLVEFGSALAAAQCAIEIQRTLVQYNATAPLERRFQVRIGVHLGDVVLREADIFGDGVNIAARIEPLAEAGGICLSRSVFDQVANKLDAALVKLGSPELKNIQMPMEVYRVVLPWHQKAATVLTGRASRRASSFPMKRVMAIGALLGLAALVLAWKTWYKRNQDAASAELVRNTAANSPGLNAPPSGRQPMLDRRRIAILPLENVSTDTNNATFSEGMMTWDLMNTLRKIAGLNVFEGKGFLTAQETGKDAAALWRGANIGALLKCRVLSEGENLRVFMQLVDSQTSEMLWSDKYDRDRGSKKVLDLCSEVAQSVATALKVQLLPGEIQKLGRRPTDNPQAYRLYIQGRTHWNEYTERGFTNSIKYYLEAINIDTNYALAYSGLADSWIQLGDGEFLPPEAAFKEAEKHAARALELDDTLGEAYVSRGTINIFYRWNWAAAKADFENALKFAPRYPDLYHFYGHYLEITGQTNEAIRRFQEGLKLDPASPVLKTELANAYYKARDYRNAIQQCLKTLEMHPDYVFAMLSLATIYNQTEQYGEALALIDRVLRLPGGDTAVPLAEQGYAFAKTKKRKEAVENLAKIKSISDREDYLDPYFLAVIHLGLADDTEALKYLAEAVDKHSLWLSWIKVEPRFDPLRGDKRFKDLVKKMGLDNL